MPAAERLADLLEEAGRLRENDPAWLLRASAVHDAISRAVLGNPAQLQAVRAAVEEAAADAGCELIVGASDAADHIVRSLNRHVTEPTRALLFDLVRITGATLAQAAAELRHVDVVPAVLVDLAPSASPATRSIVIREAARG